MKRGEFKVVIFIAMLSAFLLCGPVVRARDDITPKDSVKTSLTRLKDDISALENELATYRKNGDSVAVALALVRWALDHGIVSL